MMKHWTILLLLPTLLAACTRAPESETDPATRAIQVSIGSGPRLDITTQAATRTSLDDDGTTVKWQTDDQIALWAVNSAAQTILEAAPFSLYHYNATYNSASFRGSIPQMAEDTYAYYAVSPVPTSTEGLQASYEIPAVQDGAFHGEWDIMVADPIVGAEALREHDRKDPSGVSDNSDIVTLQFAHKIHVLKISIPKNDLGEPVSEIVLTFPKPVAGQLTVDASNPEADGVLSASSNTLTLRFAEPKDVGDVVYAMIAPVTLDEGQEISIVALGETCESETRTFVPASSDRTLAAGHTTPINYNVPALGRMFTRLNFNLPADKGRATLGEEVTRITLTAPDGSTFDNGSNIREFTPDINGQYQITLRPGLEHNLSGLKNVSVKFDSANASVSGSIDIPQIPEYASTSVQFTVPYLMYEDFSGVTAEFGSNDNGGLLNYSAEALDNYGVPGWSISRARINKYALCLRHYVAIFVDYYACANSAPLSNIAEGKSVKIKVVFNAAAESDNVKCIVGGYDTSTNRYPGTGDGVEIYGDEIDIVKNTTYAGYDKVTLEAPEYTYSITATNTTALRWKTNADFSWTEYKNAYIDNVRVSITQ